MNTTKKNNKATQKFDVNQFITDKFIEAIDRGTNPFQKTWKSSRGMPRGFAGHEYRGANFWLAVMEMEFREWEFPVFITFKKAKEIGHPIKKGSKGFKVLFQSVTVPKEYKDCPQDCPEEEKGFFTKPYTVFNVVDCENIDLSQFGGGEPTSEHIAIASAEAVIKGYKDKPKISHKGTAAFYNVQFDTITMPKKTDFFSSTGYYSVLFHELAHSTGAKHRLNRNLTGSSSSKEYAFEELVAELSAAFLNAEAGILHERFESSATYLEIYLKEMKEDNTFLRVAMTKAQKAVDYIKGTTFS